MMEGFKYLKEILSGPKGLHMLIFFVTARCNSRCRSCFYWTRLQREGDLTFGEIEKLAFSMPRFKELWLSGGEPILRKDLADIIRVFSDYNRLELLNLPTNGLLPETTESTVDRILTENRTLRLHVNLALDGFHETHDRIRGVKGNFKRTLRCITNLCRLRRDHPRFRVFINSTICRENYGEMLPLGRFILNEFDVDGHYFQIIRGDAMDPGLKPIPLPFVDPFYHDAARIYSRYLAKRGRGLAERLKASVSMGAFVFCFWTQWENYVSGRDWQMDCTAGQSCAVIDYNGDLRICELRKPIGNLRQFNLEFPKLWRSRDTMLEIERMKQDRCFCTHLCFIYDSLRRSRRAKLMGLPIRFLGYVMSQARTSLGRRNRVSLWR